MEKELEHLGLRPNEIKVYTTLLRLKASKAGLISKEARIERTSTYNALKQLQERGLVSAVMESSRKVYSAAPPNALLNMLDEQKERARMILPQLERIRYETERESILKFRGYAGVKTALNDILKECKYGEEYLILGPEGQLGELMPTFARIFVERRYRKRISARVLLRKGRKDNVRPKNSTYRYLPDEIPSPATTNIYGDKVLIILWTDTPEAIIIDSPLAAAAYRGYFEFMWQNAQKTEMNHKKS